MAWSKYQLFLAGMMVVTGSINTLATKWADTSCSKNKDGEAKPFDHPFLQACGMFVGEFSCFLVFKLMVLRARATDKEVDVGNQSFSPFIFLLPAMCDMCGTSLMYFGLNYTYASSFQMLRGAVIVFTGLLSVGFLGRTLRSFQWLGIFVVIGGLTVVGMSDILFPSKSTFVGAGCPPSGGGDSTSHSTNSLITGDLLIIIAQVIAATQMVVEEKFVSKYNVPPLQAVGWEGFFGFCVLSLLLIPMYYIQVNGAPLEDAIDGFIQLGNSAIVSVATFGNIASIAFFNFSGISVTKEISATTRMVLDSVRTLVIWAVSLAVGWQNFQYLQLIGFALLVTGMCVYENILKIPCLQVNQGREMSVQSEGGSAGPVVAPPSETDPLLGRADRTDP